MTDKEGAKWVPPYVAFPTLTGLIDRMRQEGGAPPRIDRSYLRSFSGGYQSQVIAALRAVGLIEDNGTVTENLTALVDAEDRNTRAKIIETILRERFPEPVRLGTIKATQGQLEDAFRAYGIGGDTLRKAIAFYLGAAKYANVPVSVNFRVPSVAPAEGKKAKRPKGPSGGGSSAAKVTTDDDTNSWGEQIDPAVRAWLDRIPAKGRPWPAWERENWQNVLTAILNGIYVDDGSESDMVEDEEGDEGQ